jgi:hypothetical protein
VVGCLPSILKVLGSSPCIAEKQIKSPKFSWVWWCTPVIPILGRLRQEDHKFEDSLGYTVRAYLKKKVRKKIMTDKDQNFAISLLLVFSSLIVSFLTVIGLFNMSGSLPYWRPGCLVLQSLRKPWGTRFWNYRNRWMNSFIEGFII